MIYKVLYQKNADSAPVREHTECIYLEAESERDVRLKLSDHNINIEHIQKLDGEHLDYEKKSENFVLESI